MMTPAGNKFSNRMAQSAPMSLPDTDERLWRRTCSPFWWRYWAGYRWKRLEYRYDDSPLSHYRTDQQHALALLAEQFDPSEGVAQQRQVDARRGGGRRPKI